MDPLLVDPTGVLTIVPILAERYKRAFVVVPWSQNFCGEAVVSDLRWRGPTGETQMAGPQTRDSRGGSPMAAP